MFVVRADPKNAGFIRLLKELPARWKAAQRYMAYSMAEEAKAQLLRRIPKTADYKDLRRSLEVVQGGSAKDVVFAVRARPSAQAVRKLDPKKDVVYVTAKRAAADIPDEIRVLEAFSPWPVDMLPFEPDRRFVDLVHRKVSVREVERLRKARTKSRPQWRRLLAQAGVTGTAEKRPDVSESRSVPDRVFQSLNLEFGLGTEAVPHWRPAVKEVQKPGFARKVVESGQFRKTLTDPKFRAWRAWQRGLTETVPLSEIADLRDFEDKLGIT